MVESKSKKRMLPAEIANRFSSKADFLRYFREQSKFISLANKFVTEEASDSESANELHSETGTMTHFASEKPHLRKRFASQLSENEEEACVSAS